MGKNLNKKLFLRLLQEVYQSGNKFPELNAQEEWYLDIIHSAESISSSELASITGVTKSAITPVTRKLVASGYINKTQDILDRRTYRLSVSPELAKRYKKIENKSNNILEHSDKLSEEELKELKRIIKKML